MTSMDQFQNKHREPISTIWILRRFVLPFTPWVKGRQQSEAA